jgi:phosphopantothenoylcysteine synthetase/decarboxylase
MLQGKEIVLGVTGGIAAYRRWNYFACHEARPFVSS